MHHAICALWTGPAMILFHVRAASEEKIFQSIHLDLFCSTYQIVPKPMAGLTGELACITPVSVGHEALVMIVFAGVCRR